MDLAKIINQYRYPGTKFFEPNQHNIFFGREQETGELIHSIKAHDVFVIFADSGIGKTSLLNAGIVPALEREGFSAISFRFQDVKNPPIKSIAKKLVDFYPQSSAFKDDEIKLWRIIKRCDFKNKTPLLIFDQFEEFFNHPKQDREDCIIELSDLVNDYLPDYIKDEMRLKFKEQDPTSNDLKYYSAARVKMLFLIRADKLRYLDDLSVKIPLILRNRFHLKPLNIMQARQAILLPAALPQNGFSSPTYTYQPIALDAICNYLKNEDGEVESFQLQVLCRELEKKIINRFQKDEKAELTITADELGGDKGMDSITKNYYNNQIQSIQDEAQRKQAVELIEDKLIVNDRRISLPEVLLLNQGYSKSLLDYLLNTTRLIRVDNDRYVEISHDRLLSSIIGSKEMRQKKEEEIRERQKIILLEEERAESLRKLRQEQKTKNRFFAFLVIVSLLLIASDYFFIRMIRSETDLKILTINNLILQDKYNEADTIIHVKSLFSFLSIYKKDSLQKLQTIIAKNKDIHNRFDSLSSIGDSTNKLAFESFTLLNGLMPVADSLAELKRQGNKVNFEQMGKDLICLLEQADFVNAYTKYQAALDVGIYSEKSSQAVTYGQKKIIDQIQQSFKQHIDAAYVFVKADSKENAALSIKRGTKLQEFAKQTNTQLDPNDIRDFENLK